MHITALDLMPLFWSLGFVLSLVPCLSGDYTALICTAPGSVAALLFFFLKHPPRHQVLLFFAVSCGLWLLQVLLRHFLRRQKNFKKNA